MVQTPHSTFWRGWLLLAVALWMSFAPAAIAAGVPRFFVEPASTGGEESSAGPGLRIYLYANSDPLMFSDPNGQMSLAGQILAVGSIGTLAGMAVGGIDAFLGKRDVAQGMISGGVIGGVGSVLSLIPGVGPVLLVGAAGLGGYGIGDAINQGNWPLATFRVVTTMGAFAFTRAVTTGPSRIPLGFDTEGAFLQFGAKLSGGVKKAGYGDVQAYVQGSAASGKSFRTGQPFDEGRLSDFDIALAGESLMAQAKALGIPLRSSGDRTGPLTPRQLEQLGLGAMQAELSALAGRPVNFMVFASETAAVSKADSIIIH